MPTKTNKPPYTMPGMSLGYQPGTFTSGMGNQLQQFGLGGGGGGGQFGGIGQKLLQTGAQQLLGQGGQKLAGAGLKGLIGAGLKANPIGIATTVGKGLIGGFKEMLGDRKAAKEAGKKYSFGEGLKDFGAGALKGTTGIDLTDQMDPDRAAAMERAEDETTNYTVGNNPNMMMSEKPLKALTPYTASYSAYNMSAKQANKEPLMQQISGASSLQFTPEGLDKLSNANISGKFGEIVTKEKNKQENK
tara:strand:- start:33 stop:770 length:738 start_codon:yes stop_codon:yes gene_type:complete